VAAGEKMESGPQEHKGYWCLLRAGAAAAARAPDGEVLGLLEEAASHGCWVPAGSRPLGINGDTEGRLPEWEEFLGRMAMTAAADGDEQMEDAEDAGAGEAGRRWRAYRGTTVELARERVAKMDGYDLPFVLASRGLPREVGSGEDVAAKRARLLVSLLEHPAWGCGAEGAAAVLVAGGASLERTSTGNNVGLSDDEALQAALAASASDA
jgi:hypothetical protein